MNTTDPLTVAAVEYATASLWHRLPAHLQGDTREAAHRARWRRAAAAADRWVGLYLSGVAAGGEVVV